MIFLLHQIFRMVFFFSRNDWFVRMIFSLKNHTILILSKTEKKEQSAESDRLRAGGSWNLNAVKADFSQWHKRLLWNCVWYNIAWLPPKRKIQKRFVTKTKKRILAKKTHQQQHLFIRIALLHESSNCFHNKTLILTSAYGCHFITAKILCAQILFIFYQNTHTHTTAKQKDEYIQKHQNSNEKNILNFYETQFGSNENNLAHPPFRSAHHTRTLEKAIPSHSYLLSVQNKFARHFVWLTLLTKSQQKIF